MPKKAPARNKRRGRLKPGAPDQPAQFQEGSAAPAKNFDPAKIAEEVGLWWQNDGGDKFIVRVGPEQWSILTEKKVIKLLKMRYRFISTSARVDAGETLSEVDQVLMHVLLTRCVNGLMDGLAGYPAGPHHFPDGSTVIVRTSPHPIGPSKEPGEWGLVREMIEGRLNLQRDDAENGINQTEYWHIFVRGVLRSLMKGEPGSWTQRMLVVLAGPTGCGKSRLQKLLSWLLGGREAPAKKYLTGQDQFNSDMLKSEHLKMEELDNVSKKMDDRLKLSEALKSIVANEGHSARLMRTDPTTIYPFWVATLSFNSDPDKMRPFPPLTPDFKEKVLMLLVRKAPLPLPAGTDEEKKALNVALQAQLPAYVHWLLHEFEPRKELTTDDSGQPARYGLRDFQHPALAMELFDDTPAAELLMLIDAAMFTHPANVDHKLWEMRDPHNKTTVEGLWEGTAIDLARLLMGEDDDWGCTVHREAKQLLMHNKCERLLSRLEEDGTEDLRVAKHRTKHERRWRIQRPKGLV